MDNMIAALQRGQRLGPQQPVRVRDHADENWLCDVQFLLRSISRFISA